MRKCLTLLIVLGLSNAVSAVLIAWPLEMLVEDSDFIVVGTLTDVCEFSQWRTDYGRGIITIEETLWGKIEPSQKLVLEWKNPRARRYRFNRIEHADKQHVRAIWLLKLDGKGYVRANWPTRVLAVQKKSEVLNLLGKLRTGEPKQYVPLASPEELLSPPNRLLCLTIGDILVISLAPLIGWWLSYIIRSIRRGLRKTVS